MEEFTREFYGSNEAMFNVCKKFYGRLETVPDFFFFYSKGSPLQLEGLLLQKIGSWCRRDDETRPT